MASEVSQTELLRRAIENRLLDLHTQIPAVVDSYNSDAQTVDVVVAVKRAIVIDDEPTRFEEIGVIRDVPVMFPRGGGFCMTWPLVKGDPVRLVFDEVYAGQYRDTGVVPSEPGFVGRFNLSSCVAYPGSGSDNQVLAGHKNGRMVLGFDDVPQEGGLPQIHFVPEGTAEEGFPPAKILLGPDVSSKVALANLVAIAVQQIIDLLKAGGGWTPVPNDGGAALQAAAASLVDLTENSIGAGRVFAQ